MTFKKNDPFTVAAAYAGGRPVWPKTQDLMEPDPTTGTLVPAMDKVVCLSERQTLTYTKQVAFLSAFVSSGNMTKSATAVGITYDAVLHWIQNDTLGFNTRFTQAQHTYREYLQDIAISRVEAQGSTANPLLLMFLLNGHWPERYRPRQEPALDSVARDFIAELRAAVRGGLALPKPQAAIEAQVRDVTPHEVQANEAVSET